LFEKEAMKSESTKLPQEDEKKGCCQKGAKLFPSAPRRTNVDLMGLGFTRLKGSGNIRAKGKIARIGGGHYEKTG